MFHTNTTVISTYYSAYGEEHVMAIGIENTEGIGTVYIDGRPVLRIDDSEAEALYALFRKLKQRKDENDQD
jgi:hypothetical protein